MKLNLRDKTELSSLILFRLKTVSRRDHELQEIIILNILKDYNISLKNTKIKATASIESIKRS